MAEKEVLFFCKNKECSNFSTITKTRGNCLICGSLVERIKYCPDCGKSGKPYQNNNCYYCKKYLVDYFN